MSESSDTEGEGEDALQVEVTHDGNGRATVYWWKQAANDKRVDIIVTNVPTGRQNHFESQSGATLFYLPICLTSGDRYAVTVRGTTSHKEGEVTFLADDNQVRVEQTNRISATVHWPTQLGPLVKVTLEEVTKENVTVTTFNWTVDGGGPFDVPQTLTVGQQYKVTVRGVSTDKTLTTRFRAEFTRDEMETLLRMAGTFADGVNRYPPYSAVARECEVFYRNKTGEYYIDCYIQHSGTMEVYLKDNHGDPASIINGQISGLFFSGSIDIRTGKPFSISPFGPYRVSFPAVEMFPTDAILYFADFYCNNTQHYVTLVLTKPGSDVDHFCQYKKLIKLDNRNNKFLNHRTTDSGEEYVEVTTKLMVEVFYTENLQLPDDWGSITTVPSSGTSTPGGIRKKANCKACNLPTNTDEESVLSLCHDMSTKM